MSGSSIRDWVIDIGTLVVVSLLAILSVEVVMFLRSACP